MSQQPQYCIGSSHWPGTSKLIEEMGELHQVLGKLIGSEGSLNHWSGDLKQMMIEEMGDVLAAIHFFSTENELSLSAIAARRDDKLATFREWHRQNQEKYNGGL